MGGRHGIDEILGVIVEDVLQGIGDALYQVVLAYHGHGQGAPGR
jgi:hypothetical protein